jgi:hypothetical protein
MRNRLALTVFFGVFLAAGRADAQFSVPQGLPPGEDFHVELGMMLWTPEPGIVIGSDSFSVAGSDQVDFVQEFSLEKKRFRELRGTIKAGRKHKIRFSHLPVRYDASAAIQRTLIVNGRPIPVSAVVETDLEWNLLRIGYEWDFVARSRGLIGLVTELKHNKVTASLSSTVPAASATVESTAPVPTIGIIARGYPHESFSITGEFTGMKVPDSLGENFDGRFYDLDLYGTVSLGRNLAVQGGYRSITTDYIVETDTGDLELKGLYFGGMVRF